MSINQSNFYISTLGMPEWSGRYSEPLSDGSDGPFASFEQAKATIRKMRSEGALTQPTIVWVRGGIYYIERPITFGVEDSGGMIFKAYLEEEPVVNAGRLISGWQAGTINNVQVWYVDLPEVAEGKWYFRQLFVDNKRAVRPRFPKEGHLQMKEVPGLEVTAGLVAGSDTFIAQEGDFKNWTNLQDSEVMVMHWWCEERMPVNHFDAATGKVECSRRSFFGLLQEVGQKYAQYYVENVFEALSEPGEWYLNRKTGRLYYVPIAGQDISSTLIYAPLNEKFIVIEGCPQSGKYVEGITFDGIQFENADWSLPEKGVLVSHTLGEEYFEEVNPDLSMLENVKTINACEVAAAPQAAFFIPGSISMKGARSCSIINCNISNIGLYGIEISLGCSNITVKGNVIHSMGAGGIKVGGAGVGRPVYDRTGNNIITDNHIYDGGIIFPSAVGILSMHAYGNNISHNHIHDLFYSGISCGWVWGYQDNVSKDNLIQKNHIHDLGKGVLSDMGGIYMLGVQPGTYISGNVIHDIEKNKYGGWAIYTDQGSASIIIEKNLCYNTSSQVFHQNIGRENIVRNNIFAFGREGIVAHTEQDAYQAFTFEKNIVVSDSKPMFLATTLQWKLEYKKFFSDLNILWDISLKELECGVGYYGSEAEWIFEKNFDIAQWRNTGYDMHSLVADPKFKDIQSLNFELEEDSPAYSLGFEKLDLSDVGVRK